MSNQNAYGHVPAHLQGKSFSKRDITYLIKDVNVNLQAPSIKPMHTHILKKIIAKKDLFVSLFGSEQNYDRLKNFSVTQSTAILAHIL